MNRLFASLIVVSAFATAAFSAEGWLTDHAKAVALSKKTGRPILANFTGSDWCGWCIKLHKEVFGTKEFKAWASTNVVLLELDFPRQTKQSEAMKKQNTALARKYAIQGFPTVLFLKPDGTILGRSGYMDGGPKPWVRSAGAMIAKK
jgi:protein disulfide-isomerase